MFDTMNNLSFLLNNRMDGIEIADSLLYKDFEKPLCQKYFHNTISDTCSYLSNQIEINNIRKGAGYEAAVLHDKVSKISAFFPSGGVAKSSVNIRGMGQRLVDARTNRSSCDVPGCNTNNYEDSLDRNMITDMENSSTYFRPISTNNSVDLKDEKVLVEGNCAVKSADLYVSDSFRQNTLLNGNAYEKGDHDFSNQTLHTTKEPYKVSNIEEEETEENNLQLTISRNSKYDGVFPFSTKASATIAFNDIEVISSKSQAALVTADTVDSLNINETKDSSCLSRASLSATTLLKSNGVIKPLEWSDFNNNSAASTHEISSITVASDSAPISNLPLTTKGTTITIPRGSYIFIPLSVQNFPVKDKNISLDDFQSASSISNGNNKYILGCYPVLSQLQDVMVQGKQLPPIIPPTQACSQSTSAIFTDVEHFSTSTTQFNPSQTSNMIPITLKTVKKKAESTEFNYYLSMISDSHKLLLKEKSKISADRNFIKDDSLTNVINYASRNNNNTNKVDKELNLLINTLFEINVLISKIEALRGLTFIEPFYKVLQSAAEMIQGFHCNEGFTQCSQLNTNFSKHNETDVDLQIEKLKQLFSDLQKIRTFFWASYTNFTLDRERLCSTSLNKLKSWCECKKKMRHFSKLKEVSAKCPSLNSSTRNGENANSYQNATSNSTRQTMKFDRNAMSVQTQSYQIPVSQYHNIPNRMATILQRFPNQLPTNSPQYNYIQTSLSNFSHPTLINSNKFSLGSNCRLSYRSQQQLYTATPLNTTHSTIPPTNFLIGPPSLMTPIIYQNNSHPVINNQPVNFMLYKTNNNMI